MPAPVRKYRIWSTKVKGPDKLLGTIEGQKKNVEKKAIKKWGPDVVLTLAPHFATITD